MVLKEAMSAGVCGKRVGFEEVFGSSPKRFRCSSFESPNPSSDSGSRPEDPVSTLLQIFPALDSELIASGLRNHNNKIEDPGESSSAPFEGTATCGRFPEHDVEDASNIKLKFDHENEVDRLKWVDLFVHEMVSATNIDDARGRAARFLEAFEVSITANKRAADEMEYASLKQHLQSLLDDNQSLRRSVAIQHEWNLEQEGKEREVQHLKLTLNKYLEQVRALEMNNYTLRLHLHQAEESSSIHGQFSF